MLVMSIDLQDLSNSINEPINLSTPVAGSNRDRARLHAVVTFQSSSMRDL